MSYGISLERNGEPVAVESHQEGGTIQLGGCDEAEMNVTYNYSKLFDFRALDGKTGQETIGPLRLAVIQLGVEKDENYWLCTAGNVGHCCSVLLKWAERHPDAEWSVR